MSVVQLIAQNSNINHPMLSLIQSCKMLIAGSWDCTVNHVFREGNYVADGLARLGYGKEIGILFFDVPPSDIKVFWDANFRGVVSTMQCSISSLS
ncbi:hypothetical protein Dsin_008946 [Dipteronia sinensis]|uniref:RNase H type-1 domain-containing protein n=1 Tax=Dipteronia sinensis TaxID=43782 RepID=A0AAE0APK6_9ROSI|nr:hypothetical protein Dsin_008946 [Dipteronia sinensis]